MVGLPDIPFPTLDRAGIRSLPPISRSDTLSMSRSWLSSFTSLCASAVTDSLLASILYPLVPAWRDVLALTWDIRTFIGLPKIAALLRARLADAKLRNFDVIE